MDEEVEAALDRDWSGTEKRQKNTWRKGKLACSRNEVGNRTEHNRSKQKLGCGRLGVGNRIKTAGD